MEKFVRIRPHNHLLSSMSPVDFGLLQPNLEPVVLPLRLKLQVPNKPITHVYFPEAGIVSIVDQGVRGDAVETAIFGCEGMSGLPIILGDSRSPQFVYVQIAGHGQRIQVNHLRNAMRNSATLQLGFLRFAQALTVQMARTGFANGQALLEERLARWILMAHDRLPGDGFLFTHQLFAIMLGVRRSGVTEVLGLLRKRGLIRTMRGQILVEDRVGLEELADEYYGVVEAEYARLIGWHREHKAKTSWRVRA